MTVVSTTTAASFATHRRNRVSRRCTVKGFAVSGPAAWSTTVRWASAPSGRRYQLIETSCVYNFYVCTVVHTTAKIITITSVAHVARSDACVSVQSATAAVHVVFSSSRVTPRLVRCPRTTGQVLVPAAVVRQAAVATVSIVRLLLLLLVVIGVTVRAHADVRRSFVTLLLLRLVVMMRHRRRLLVIAAVMLLLLLWLVMLIMWHNSCVLVVGRLASVTQQGGTSLATATRLRLVV